MQTKMFIAVIIAAVCFQASFEVRSQDETKINISPPVVGEPNAQPDDGPLTGSGSPLLTDISFSELAKLLHQAAADHPQTRGAREIAVYKRAAPAVVLIKTKSGSGSGIVLTSGLVLTNRHVVEGVGAAQVFFKMADTNRSEHGVETRVARVKVVDPSRDLALLQIGSPPAAQTALKIASKDGLDIGADVYAIGHPLGYEWTFTQGIVSGVRHISSDGQNYTAIQTQTPINPGNSGGPLLNSDSEVVGVNTWVRDISTLDKQETSGGAVTIARPAQGLNFAVSARDIREFIGDFEAGRITTLPLQISDNSVTCLQKPLFVGRNKDGDAQLHTYSLRCDSVADAWKIEPDNKAKPVRFHFDPDRTSKSTIVVMSDNARSRWELSYWDFFKDATFAVVGRHEDGKLVPTKFEFAQF